MHILLSNIENYLKYYSEVFGDDIIATDVQLPDFEQVSVMNVDNNNIDIVDNQDNNIVVNKDSINNIIQDSVINQDNTIKSIKSNNTIQEPQAIEETIQHKAPATSQEKDWQSSTTLEEMQAIMKSCRKCKLANTRNNVVFGSGNPNADILIIGEGPGADEDMTGLPFVGRSGQLLTKILEAIELSRSEVYIANIVKCRPPQNRRPESEEVQMCEPYLIKQIDIIKPKFILALGLTAVDTLFKKSFKMADIRGKIMEYHGIKTLATYHPAALLRNPNYKKDTWADVKLLRQLYLESKEQEL